MIPFNKPYYSGKEKSYIAKAIGTGVLTGEMSVLDDCESLLEKRYNFPKVFITNSCTMALEMSALLIDIQPGDEVILPSFTFVSTGNAFALRGAKLIFADSRPDNPNIDECKLESLITEKTKAIVVVHYAGIACDMDEVLRVAKKYKLRVIEDAAQSIDSYYKNKPLGSFADISCFSFHETKNIHCGEGGFIVVNDPELQYKCELIRNKGTNRVDFLNGKVNKYEWVGLGFSAIPSGITLAFLYRQLQCIDLVQKKRIAIWKRYYTKFKGLQKKGVELPVIPDYAANNAHIFYLVCRTAEERSQLISFLKSEGIQAVFHYQPLHSSSYYENKNHSEPLPNAEKYASRLIRLPLYFKLTKADQDLICKKMIEFYSR